MSMDKRNVVDVARTPCSNPECTNHADDLGDFNEALCRRCRSMAKSSSSDLDNLPLQDVGASLSMISRHRS